MIDTKTTVRSKSLPRVQRLASEAARGLNERREASNVNWIALRAENERRAKAAQEARARRTREARVEPLQWLDDATRSVPAYEIV